jgi:hypothetical protein
MCGSSERSAGVHALRARDAVSCIRARGLPSAMHRECSTFRGASTYSSAQVVGPDHHADLIPGVRNSKWLEMQILRFGPEALRFPIDGRTDGLLRATPSVATFLAFFFLLQVGGAGLRTCVPSLKQHGAAFAVLE